jgi:tetratricopeptide (TPR) repeat protein
VIGKYIDDSSYTTERAREAFGRAIELNPRLSVAHKFCAHLEADTGHGESAMVRLLTQARRHGNDPELFAGLVHACRYCGLYDQSIAAHGEARRLDPNIPTSLEQTILMTGDIDRLLGLRGPLGGSGDEGIRVIGLGLAGRREEARQALLAMRWAVSIPLFQVWTDYLMAWLERRPADMVVGMGAFGALKIMEDPEAVFQQGWLLCDAGEHGRGLAYLQRAVANHYFVASTLAAAPAFDALRGSADFDALVAQAEAGRARTLAAFHDAGGSRLLGLTS